MASDKKMNIIFDEYRAAKEAEQYLRSVRRNHRFEKAFKVVCGFGVVLMIATPVCNRLQIGIPAWLFWVAGGVALSSFAAYVAISDNPYQPPNVAYYFAKEGKTVLEIIPTDICFKTHPAVRVTTEDREGTVETVELELEECRESTRFSELTVDFNEGIAYMPYKQESEE